jgi:hypothetical protein
MHFIRIGMAGATIVFITALNPRASAAELAQNSELQASGATITATQSQDGFVLNGDMVISRETAIRAKALSSAWSTGHKTLLFIRVDFADQPGGLSTEADANALIESANSFYLENSYGAVSISGTVTPVLRMPRLRSQYSGVDYGLLADARAAALNAGYDTSQYDLDLVQFGPDNGSGYANIGAKGLWLGTTAGGILIHELGHNFGLWHANNWNAISDTVVGPGTNIEYGNLWDTMAKNIGQFNVCHKSRLGWLQNDFILTVTNSGVYRLYSFDDDVLVSNRIYALKIHKDFERDYWVERRRKLIPYYNNRWITNGVLINWSPWSLSNGGTDLLNPLPDNDQADYNRVLVMGKTLADPEAQVFITPLNKATNDEWMDIAVRFGPFPTNHSPVTTLTVSATNVTQNQPVQFSINAHDPDGDPVGYFWDFGRDNFHTQNGPNAATVSYSFIDQGEHLVFCLISDMKGGLSVQSALIRVGAPQYTRISGRVTHHGQPVSGAYVFFPSPEGAFRSSTYSDDNGSFALTGVNPRSRTILAMKWLQTFAPVGFSNPFFSTNNLDGLRFDDGLPWLTAPRPVPGGWIVEASVLSGTNYSLDGSTNLASWTVIAQTNAVTDNVGFFDSQLNPVRFYRLRAE